MGMIDCKTHGLEGIQLVCSHIEHNVKSGVEIKEYIEVRESINNLIHLKLGYCLDCINNLNLPTDNQIVFVESEEESSRVFGPLFPICYKCLKEARVKM
jgi:hypothetical protein